jgi:CelD/BcsL family acetyltransferase involved in cellulose biosynthesis
MEHIEIVSIEDVEQFKNLHIEWNELIENSASCNVFLTWEWLFTWWEVYGGSRELELLLARENGRLIGIAPLCSKMRRIFGPLRFKILEFMGTGAVASDHLDFIVEKGREEEVLSKFLKYYFENSKWDRIEFGELFDGSKTSDIVRGYVKDLPRIKMAESVAHVCPCVVLPKTWEEYIDSLSWRNRKHIRHDSRRLIEIMGAEFVNWRDQTTLHQPLRRLSELHQERWTSRGRLGSYGTERFRIFHEKLINRLFPKGIMRIYALKLGDKIIAVFYAFVMKSTLYCYSTGFDAELDKYGPGTVLISRIIREAIEENIREFDFLRGNSDYKERWRPRKRINKNLLISKSGSKEFCMSLFERLKEVCRYGGKRILPERLYRSAQRMRDFIKYR